MNCYNAYKLGNAALENIIGLKFEDVKLKQSSKVHSLASVTNLSVPKLKKTQFDPLNLFCRLCMLKTDEDELETLFQYELSPYTLSLFKEGTMRKTQKSALYTVFNPMEDTTLENCHYVIDGGFLLHCVVWPRNENFSSICNMYYNYITKHYSTSQKISVVFDGYDADGLKEAERRRRYTKMAPDIIFN